MSHDPGEATSFGTWPRQRRGNGRAVVIGCVIPFGLFVGFISIAAWVALFRGHPEAILWALTPLLVLAILRYRPSTAGRGDGEVVEVPALRGTRIVRLSDVVDMAPAAGGLPWVTVRLHNGQRTMRWWCAPDLAAFIAGIRNQLPAGADRVPVESAWIARRRRTWIVLLLIVGVSDA